MIFAFLFGLSMDYEVFMLTRMREAYDDTGSTDRAIVPGIGRTGRLVTSAALILFLAFLVALLDPDGDIKVLATGLGAGILLDAAVIRALLVPAFVGAARALELVAAALGRAAAAGGAVAGAAGRACRTGGRAEVGRDRVTPDRDRRRLPSRLARCSVG